MTKAQAQRDIRQMRDFIRREASTPDKARELLIRAGILEKSGKKLAKYYR